MSRRFFGSYLADVNGCSGRLVLKEGTYCELAPGTWSVTGFHLAGCELADGHSGSHRCGERVWVESTPPYPFEAGVS